MTQNFIDKILQNEKCNKHGGGFHFFSPDNPTITLSTLELIAKAYKLSKTLTTYGDVGDRIMVCLPSGCNYIISFLACIMSGCIPVHLTVLRPKPFCVSHKTDTLNTIHPCDA